MIKPIYTIWLRDIKQALRRKITIISHLGQPLLWMFLLGMGLRGSVDTGGWTGMEVDYLAFMLPGIIGMSILFSSMRGGMRVIYDRKFGFLKEMMVAPIPRVSIVLGITLASATISVLQGMLIILIATIIGVNLNLNFIPVALLFIFLIGMTFTGLSVAISTRIEDIFGFEGTHTFITLPLFLLSGALFPVTKLPEPLQIISYVNPLFYGVDGLRAALIGVSSMPIWLDLMIMILFCTGLIVLSAYLFNKCEGV